MPTLTQSRFWFLRHGETDWNAKGWSQGNVDIPLNANGITPSRPRRDTATGATTRPPAASVIACRPEPSAVTLSDIMK